MHDTESPNDKPRFLSLMRDAVKYGKAVSFPHEAPAGRAERLGLTPPATSLAESLPSRFVQAGHRHRIGGELTGQRGARQVAIFDLRLETDVGGGSHGNDGVDIGSYHVAVSSVPNLAAPASWCVSRSDVTEHFIDSARSSPFPQAGRLNRVRIFTDQQWTPNVAFLDWLAADLLKRDISQRHISLFELTGPWALIAIPMNALEKPDEMAEELAAKIGRRHGLGAWPEQLLDALDDAIQHL